MIADEEHIYASLPEEEEESDAAAAAAAAATAAGDAEDCQKASGSFSARSTLPDNCQLITYDGGESYPRDYGPQNNQLRMNGTVANTDQLTTTTNTVSDIDRNGNFRTNEFQIIETNQQTTDHHGSNSSSSSSTVGDNTEDIYEEVSNLMELSLNDFERIKSRTDSQDTLIGIGDDNHRQNDKEEDDDDDDDGVLEEDRISMISQASSSTFSSFTTCANQDFEFIISQNEISDASPGEVVNAGSDHLQPPKETLKTNEAMLEPSTLSLAAMYYNRFILNEKNSGGGGGGGSRNAKCGHRQRASKINRRQSFSTAYELRQRILYNQLNRSTPSNNGGGVGGDDIKMNLIEEECEDNEAEVYHQGLNKELEELLTYKLSRRISTSEDNLLSIISTIANCGDENNDLDQTLDDHQEGVGDSGAPLERSSPSNGDRNGTFVLKKDGELFTKKPLAKTKSDGVSRASNLPVLKSPKVTSGIQNSATKITIKELKSKKQTSKQVSIPKFQPKITSNSKVYELGSLWERSKFTPAKNNNFKPTDGKCKLISKKSTSSTSSSSSASTPTSPSRVPVFISVSPMRTTQQQQQQRKFHSKLPEPSQYLVKQKQDPRQNAILAKNALLLSGVKNDR